MVFSVKVKVRVKDINKVKVEEQPEELKSLAEQHFCERCEEQEVNLNSKLAQVAMGVRRSGKSILCYNALSKARVHFAYINFDDERFEGKLQQ